MASTNALSYTTGRHKAPSGPFKLTSRVLVSANPTANDTIKLFHEDDLKGLRVLGATVGASVDMDSGADFAYTLRANDGSTQQNIIASGTCLQGTGVDRLNVGAGLGYHFQGDHYVELLWTVDAAGFTAGTITVVLDVDRKRD